MIQHKNMIHSNSIQTNIIMNPSVSLFSTYIMSRYGFNSAAFRPVDLYFLELMGFDLDPHAFGQVKGQSPSSHETNYVQNYHNHIVNINRSVNIIHQLRMESDHHYVNFSKAFLQSPVSDHENRQNKEKASSKNPVKRFRQMVQNMLDQQSSQNNHEPGQDLKPSSNMPLPLQVLLASAQDNRFLKSKETITKDRKSNSLSMSLKGLEMVLNTYAPTVNEPFQYGPLQGDSIKSRSNLNVSSQHRATEHDTDQNTFDSTSDSTTLSDKDMLQTDKLNLPLYHLQGITDQILGQMTGLMPTMTTLNSLHFNLSQNESDLKINLNDSLYWKSTHARSDLVHNLNTHSFKEWMTTAHTYLKHAGQLVDRSSEVYIPALATDSLFISKITSALHTYEGQVNVVDNTSKPNAYKTDRPIMGPINNGQSPSAGLLSPLSISGRANKDMELEGPNKALVWSHLLKTPDRFFQELNTGQGPQDQVLLNLQFAHSYLKKYDNASHVDVSSPKNKNTQTVFQKHYVRTMLQNLGLEAHVFNAHAMTILLSHFGNSPFEKNHDLKAHKVHLNHAQNTRQETQRLSPSDRATIAMLSQQLDHHILENKGFSQDQSPNDGKQSLFASYENPAISQMLYSLSNKSSTWESLNIKPMGASLYANQSLALNQNVPEALLISADETKHIQSTYNGARQNFSQFVNQSFYQILMQQILKRQISEQQISEQQILNQNFDTSVNVYFNPYLQGHTENIHYRPSVYFDGAMTWKSLVNNSPNHALMHLMASQAHLVLSNRVFTKTQTNVSNTSSKTISDFRSQFSLIGQNHLLGNHHLDNVAIEFPRVDALVSINGQAQVSTDKMPVQLIHQTVYDALSEINDRLQDKVPIIVDKLSHIPVEEPEQSIKNSRRKKSKHQKKKKTQKSLIDRVINENRQTLKNMISKNFEALFLDRVHEVVTAHLDKQAVNTQLTGSSSISEDLLDIVWNQVSWTLNEDLVNAFSDLVSQKPITKVNKKALKKTFEDLTKTYLEASLNTDTLKGIYQEVDAKISAHYKLLSQPLQEDHLTGFSQMQASGNLQVESGQEGIRPSENLYGLKQRLSLESLRMTPNLSSANLKMIGDSILGVGQKRDRLTRSTGNPSKDKAVQSGFYVNHASSFEAIKPVTLTQVSILNLNSLSGFKKDHSVLFQSPVTSAKSGRQANNETTDEIQAQISVQNILKATSDIRLDRNINILEEKRKQRIDTAINESINNITSKTVKRESIKNETIKNKASEAFTEKEADLYQKSKLKAQEFQMNSVVKQIAHVHTSLDHIYKVHLNPKLKTRLNTTLLNKTSSQTLHTTANRLSKNQEIEEKTTAPTDKFQSSISPQEPGTHKQAFGLQEREHTKRFDYLKTLSRQDIEAITSNYRRLVTQRVETFLKKESHLIGHSIRIDPLESIDKSLPQGGSAFPVSQLVSGTWPTSQSNASAIISLQSDDGQIHINKKGALEKSVFTDFSKTYTTLTFLSHAKGETYTRLIDFVMNQNFKHKQVLKISHDMVSSVSKKHKKHLRLEAGTLTDSLRVRFDKNTLIRHSDLTIGIQEDKVLVHNQDPIHLQGNLSKLKTYIDKTMSDDGLIIHTSKKMSQDLVGQTQAFMHKKVTDQFIKSKQHILTKNMTNLNIHDIQEVEHHTIRPIKMDYAKQAVHQMPKMDEKPLSRPMQTMEIDQEKSSPQVEDLMTYKSPVAERQAMEEINVDAIFEKIYNKFEKRIAFEKRRRGL